MRRYFWVLLLVLSSTPVIAEPTSLNDPPTISNKRWGIFIYHSWMTNNNIGPVLTAQDIHFKYGTMNSIDLSYQLAPANPLRRFFQPLVNTIELAGNITTT